MKLQTLNSDSHPILFALVAVACLLASCSSSNNVKVLANPDNVPIISHVYAVSDARLAAIEFSRLTVSEQMGPNTRLSNPQKLQGYQNLSDAVALVVERKFPSGATLTPADLNAVLTGVGNVPESFKDDLNNGNYRANATAAKLPLRSQETTREGQIVQMTLATEGTLTFVWFLPKATRQCEVVFGTAKPVNFELPQNR